MPQALRFNGFDEVVALDPPAPATARQTLTFDGFDDVMTVDQQPASGQTAARLARGSQTRQTDNVAAEPADADSRGLLRRVWDRANAPLLPSIATAARGLSQRITNPSRAAAAVDIAASLMTGLSRPGEARGFVAGALEGAGDVAASLTSPANLALAATTAGASGAARAGLVNTARALRGAEAVAGGAYTAEGAHQVATAPDVAGKLVGVAEMAGGAAGVVHGGRGARRPRTRTEPSTRAAVDDVAAVEPLDVDTPDARASAAVEPTAPTSSGRASFDDVVALEPAEPRASAPSDGTFETVSPSAVDAAPARSTDIRELHGGLGAVGRLGAPDHAPLNVDPAPQKGRAVGTIDPETATAPVPPAKPMRERQRLEGVKLDSFDDTVRPALREVLEQHDGFAGQRRDVQTWERTQQLAQQIEVDVSRSLPKGRVLNAEETTSFANTLATLTDRVTTLAGRAARAELDDVGRLALEEARAAQVAVMQSLWGTVTEQGRALNAWKATKRVMETHDAAFIKQALRFVKDEGAELKPLLDQLGNDPVKQYGWLKDQARQRRSMSDWLSSYYYANILSGPATHERNIISNSANLLFGLAADAGAGRVGQTRANLAGMWNALTKGAPSEGPYALALPRAFKEVYFHLRHGFSPTDVQMGKLDFGRIMPEFAGGGRNPFNYPSRALNAADGFFRALVNQGERYRAAYQIAKRGTKGTLEERMADALADLPREVEREIAELTSRAVFQETPGAVTQAFLQLRDTVPAMRYVVPFVRIVANLTRQSMEASPAGFAMKSARQAGRVGETARAKAALGTVALLPISYYAAAGRITGSGPSDPGERQAWLDSGKRPNSIQNPLTGSWVNYMSWQPVALPMSMVANLIEAWQAFEERRPRRSGGTPITTGRIDAEAQQAALDAWTRAGLEAVLRTGNSVLQQSFLSGVSSLMEALNDPERSANRFFSRLAQGFVPLSGAMRTATQVADPVVRTPETVREAVDTVVPGRSTRVAPLIDRFGEETTGTGSPLTRGFYQASASKADQLQPFLEYAGVQPGRPRRTLTDAGEPVALSRKEQTALQQARGRTRRAAYERVWARYGDRWARVPSETLNDEITGADSRAQAELTAYAKRLKRAGRSLTVEALLERGRRR